MDLLGAALYTPLMIRKLALRLYGATNWRWTLWFVPEFISWKELEARIDRSRF